MKKEKATNKRQIDERQLKRYREELYEHSKKWEATKRLMWMTLNNKKLVETKNCNATQRIQARIHIQNYNILRPTERTNGKSFI